MGGGARTAAAGVIVVDRATVHDLADIAAMERACFSDPWSRNAFGELLESPPVFFAVARDHAGAPPLGYVVALLAADEGEIANIAVGPESRRRGIGARMLDAVMEEAARRGVVTLYLEVRESNEAARELYASRGFEAVGRRRSYYRKPVEDALVLRGAVTLRSAPASSA